MSQGIEIGSAHREASVRLPRKPVYVLMSDEEMTVLATGTSHPLSNLFWGALGLLLGSLYPSVASIPAVSAGRLGLLDLLPILIACMSFVACALSAWLILRAPSPSQQLLDEIRARPEVPLRTIADLKYP